MQRLPGHAHPDGAWPTRNGVQQALPDQVSVSIPQVVAAPNETCLPAAVLLAQLLELLPEEDPARDEECFGVLLYDLGLLEHLFQLVHFLVLHGLSSA